MEQIISNNKILEQLTCSNCFKYLSILPVKVYPDHSMLCGRCVKPKDLGVKSLYCDLVENVYFKCINHLEGCEVLMKPLQMAHHEKNCLPTKIICPVCNLEMDCFLIYKHFKDFHETGLLKHPILEISFLEDDVQFWIYKSDNFVVLIKTCVRDNTLFLVCADFGYKKQENSLRYSIEMYNGSKIVTKSEECKCFRSFDDYSFSYKVRASLCKVVINFSDYFESVFQQIQFDQSPDIEVPEKLTRLIYLSNNFKINHPKWKLSSNKRAITNFKNFISSQGFCSECQNIIGNVYDKCNGFCKRCIGRKDLLPIYEKLRFYCVWNCGKHFTEYKLYKHENICKNRTEITCPIADCIRKCSNTKILKKHLDYAHNQVLWILDNILFEPEIQDPDVIIYFRHTIIDLNITKVHDKYKVKLNSVRYLLMEDNNMFCTIISKIVTPLDLDIEICPDWFIENTIRAQKLTRLIYLTNEFKKLYPNWKLTTNQRAIISSNNYMTIQGFCYHCQNIISSIELKCSEDGICETCIPKKNDLLPIYNKLMFFCIWNCGKYFIADELYDHENFCEQRGNIDCILCSEKFSNLEDFKNHIENVHNDSFLICDKELNVDRISSSTIIYFRHILINVNKFDYYCKLYRLLKPLFEIDIKCELFNKNGEPIDSYEKKIPFNSPLYVKFE